MKKGSWKATCSKSGTLPALERKCASVSVWGMEVMSAGEEKRGIETMPMNSGMEDMPCTISVILGRRSMRLPL